MTDLNLAIYVTLEGAVFTVRPGRAKRRGSVEVAVRREVSKYYGDEARFVLLKDTDKEVVHKGRLLAIYNAALTAAQEPA